MIAHSLSSVYYWLYSMKDILSCTAGIFVLNVCLLWAGPRPKIPFPTRPHFVCKYCRPGNNLNLHIVDLGPNGYITLSYSIALLSLVLTGHLSCTVQVPAHNLDIKTQSTTPSSTSPYGSNPAAFNSSQRSRHLSSSDSSIGGGGNFSSMAVVDRHRHCSSSSSSSPYAAVATAPGAGNSSRSRARHTSSSSSLGGRYSSSPQSEDAGGGNNGEAMNSGRRRTRDRHNIDIW